jgi:ribonuclease D
VEPDLANHLHEGDLPEGLFAGATSLAIDSETMGLNLRRDPLCVVQLSAGDGDAHMVRLDRSTYACPNLKALLLDPSVLKIFHFGRFDIAKFQVDLGIDTNSVWCTKIASKIARTYTDRHGLKDVVKELVGIDLSKAQQSSDWGNPRLSPEQLAYAATDVLHLHAVKEKLEIMLIREGRMALAQACFDFLPHRARLDLAGWEEMDIFAHS